MSDTVNVVMPDGTVVAMPRTLSGDQLKSLETFLPSPPTRTSTFVREGTASLVDNLMGVPDIAANALTRTANDLLRPVRRAGELAGAVRTGDFSQFSPDPRLQTEDPRRNYLDTFQTPPFGQDFIMPTSEQVFAGAQMAGERAGQLMTGSDTPVASFPEALANQRQITEAGRQTNPLTAMAGDVAGDVATLTSLRQPFAANRALSQVAHRRNVEAARVLAERGARDIAREPTVFRAVKNAFGKGTNLSTLMNRAGRAAEAGLEGATVALLNDGDPIEIGAYSAAGQLAGSALTGGVTGILKGGVTAAGTRIMGSALAIGALIQTAKTAIPGGNDFILNSIESGFPKVMLGIALGSLSGLAGAGRVSGGFPVTAIPRVADAITTIPRAAVISVLNEALKNPSHERVINLLAQDPNYFGESAGRQIQRAIANDDISLEDTMNRLLKSNAFRQRLEAASE